LWRAEDPKHPAPHTLFDAYAITGYVSAGLGYAEKQPVVRRWLEESLTQAEATARDNGLTGDDLDAYVRTHQYDHAFALAGAELLNGRITGETAGTITDLATRIFPYHRDVAQDHGMQLIMYEGGTHVVGVGPVVDDKDLDMFFRALNYSEEMGAIYSHLLSAWARVTDGPFNVFNDVGYPSKSGSWGLVRHLGDTDNPRWNTVLRYRDGDNG